MEWGHTKTSGSEEALNGADNPIEVIDVSDERVEKLARGYFVGKSAVGRRRDVRKLLEDRVVGKIGKSGKLLVDKLFELVEGVYIADKIDKVGEKVKVVSCYKTPPSLNAIIYALDRVLGKPKQVNIQGNFSLSSLLINTTNGNGNQLRSGDNEKVPAKPELLFGEDMGLN